MWPDERFPLVYADPPWLYRDKANAGKRGAEHKYPCLQPMDIAQILDVNAAESATMFMWATWPLLPTCLFAAKLAGFEYKTNGFVWVKTTATGKDHVGMGHWTRANSEPCLVLTRGNGYPRPASRSVRQVVHGRIREHSAKPPEVRDRIVELMGDVPRIELFARERHEGWQAAGFEVDERLDPGSWGVKR